MSRSTEFRHWMAAKREFCHNTAPVPEATCSNACDQPVEEIDQPTEELDRERPPSTSPTHHAEDENEDANVHGYIIWSIVEAMQLVDDMDASQKNFMQILAFGKQLTREAGNMILLIAMVLMSFQSNGLNPGKVQ